MDFGFRENPFLDVPDLRFTYRHRIFQDVCADLMFVRMSNRRGIALIEGPAGSGKTTLLATLDANRKPGESSVTLSAHRRLSVAKMIDICADALRFDIDKGLEPNDLEGRLSAMSAHLAGMSDKGGVILLIDRAEMLSANFMEDLPRLMNLGRDGGAAIHVVLSVTCEDDADPLPSAFNAVQNMIHFRSWLGSMSEDEVARYISHRLIVAGDSIGKLYTDDGMAALNRYSGGIPGRINAISRQCIEFLTAEFMEEADAATVQRAADVLGLKPRARVGSLSAAPSKGPAAAVEAARKSSASSAQDLPEPAAPPKKRRSPFKKLRKRGQEGAEAETAVAPPPEVQSGQRPGTESGAQSGVRHREHPPGGPKRRPRDSDAFDPGSNVVGLPTRNAAAANRRGAKGAPSDGGGSRPASRPAPRSAPMEARLLQTGGRATEGRRPEGQGSAAAREARPVRETRPSRETGPSRETRPSYETRPDREPSLSLDPAVARDAASRPRRGAIPPDAWDEPTLRGQEKAEGTRQRRQERPPPEEVPVEASPRKKLEEINKRRPYLLSRLGVVIVLILIGVLLLGVYGRPQKSVEPIAAKAPPEGFTPAPEDERLNSLESRVAELASRLSQVQDERDSLVTTLSALELADQEAKVAPDDEAAALSPSGNDLVRDLQKELGALGLDPGQSDGRLGQRTLEAIARYQEQQGLKVDRQVSRALLDHMRALSLLKQAVVFYHDKDFRAAESAYDDVVHLQPGDANARFFRSIARLKLGETAAAIEGMNWRGQADPKLPMASFPPSRVYYIQERLGALGFDPGRSDGLYDTGTKNAINAYQRVQGLKIDGEPSLDLLRHLEVYSHHAAAIDAYRRGDTERALALYDLVLRLDGDDAEVYFNRGLAHRRAGELDAALADYSKAIDEDSSLAKAYYERGSLAFEAGRYGPAVGDYISAAQAWLFDS